MVYRGGESFEFRKAEGNVGGEASRPLSGLINDDSCISSIPLSHLSQFLATMESIAALGLASNIIQIVDFSSRVISRIEEVYHSPDGQTVEYAALSIAAKRLDELSTSLLISGQSKGYAILSTANKQLIQLKKECTKVVEEVEDELKQAKLKASSGNRKWQSIRQGLKSVRNDKHMSALNLRLSAIREQIDTAVLISIRYGFLTSLECSRLNILQRLNCRATKEPC